MSAEDWFLNDYEYGDEEYGEQDEPLPIWGEWYNITEKTYNELKEKGVELVVSIPRGDGKTSSFIKSCIDFLEESEGKDER